VVEDGAGGPRVDVVVVDTVVVDTVVVVVVVVVVVLVVVLVVVVDVVSLPRGSNERPSSGGFTPLRSTPK